MAMENYNANAPIFQGRQGKNMLKRARGHRPLSRPEKNETNGLAAINLAL